ncbi:LEA type 2 family protein [Methylophaga sp.]|uniref:LEA type 2 family protein n=1 Tax=Methylophaga sp. TaxID=2024840 RepID=UPI003A8EDEFE
MPLIRIFCLLAIVFLSGCASWSPSYEKPQVNITSFSFAPESNGLAPRFIIGLQIINPNRNALPLEGMSYSVEVENNRVLSGATPDLPRVPGYGMADFTIEASPDLLGSARLINRLLSSQANSLDYTFKAKLDMGRLVPYLNIEESGQFDLSNTSEN